MKWRKLVMITLVGVFLYSSYQIFTYYYDSYKSGSTYDTIRRQYQEQLELEHKEVGQPETAPEQIDANLSNKAAIMGRYLPLLEINPDVVGWISVPDTVIEYPVVQAQDNDFYLRRNIYGEKASAGTIFMDYRNDSRCKGKNTILYGHHMRNGSMFKDLIKYKNEEFFQDKDRIKFHTLFNEIEWQVFSVYIADANVNYIQTSFDTGEEYSTFLETVKQKSIFEKNTELSKEDQILTLSTCTYEYDDARLVVHARRVRD